ncbi:unnamed protein product, partial [Dibothriocephalus latus]
VTDSLSSNEHEDVEGAEGTNTGGGCPAIGNSRCMGVDGNVEMPDGDDPWISSKLQDLDFEVWALSLLGKVQQLSCRVFISAEIENWSALCIPSHLTQVYSNLIQDSPTLAASSGKVLTLQNSQGRKNYVTR